MKQASFASLSPTLLARKGGAKPAMRPQLGTLDPQVAQENLEDLGWNDMGAKDTPEEQPEAEVVHLTPAPANAEAEAEAREHDREAEHALAKAAEPEIKRQQQNLADRVAKPRRTPRKRRSALASGGRAAFTLRLDAERHLKLRLACTIRNRSAQQIVTEALDALLESMPDIETLASQVKRR